MCVLLFDTEKLIEHARKSTYTNTTTTTYRKFRILPVFGIKENTKLKQQNKKSYFLFYTLQKEKKGCLVFRFRQKLASPHTHSDFFSSISSPFCRCIVLLVYTVKKRARVRELSS
jgi:hypothetical protein